MIKRQNSTNKTESEKTNTTRSFIEGKNKALKNQNIKGLTH